MKVLLLTYGSRGDVQPFVAFATALNAAGHEAILGAPAGSGFLAEPYGVRMLSLYDKWDELKEDPTFRAAFETNYRGIRGIKLTLRAMRKFRRVMARVLDDMASVADLDVDVVVHQPNVPGNEVAERIGVPAVPACLQPMWVPTRSFANPLIPFRLPALFNRASYLATRLWIRGYVGNTASWRRNTLGLPRRRGHHNVLLRPDGTPATVLHAFSRYILPDPIDYPEWVHTTGYWFLPAPQGWAPSLELSRFIEAGDPPVYIGFGSLVFTDPTHTGRLVAEAVRLAGVRAVIVAGWGGIQPVEPNEQIHYLDQAPFDWLFPRMKAIVHHGGCGTMAAALASGRPQVICPSITDQPFHAWRMHANGLAPPPLLPPHLTAETLADAIRQAVNQPSMAARANELGHCVRAEDGVTRAVKVLESGR